MTTEEIQISTINKLKSLNKDLQNVRKTKTAWILRLDEFYLEFAFEDTKCKQQIEKLSNEEKHLENELSNLIESL